MGFRKDGVVERLAEGFPEQEGTQIVQMHARHPSVAQVGVAVESEFLAALLLVTTIANQKGTSGTVAIHGIADIDAAILHRVQVEMNSVPGRTLPRNSRVCAGPRRREVLNAIERIVAAAMAQ